MLGYHTCTFNNLDLLLLNHVCSDDFNIGPIKCGTGVKHHASNLSQTSCLISKHNMNFMEVQENGWNSKSLLKALIKFYVRNYLPSFLGGFKKKLSLKFKKFR